MLLRETLVLSYSTAYESGEADLERCGRPLPTERPHGPQPRSGHRAVGSSLTHGSPGLIGTPGHPSVSKHTCFHWTWISLFSLRGQEVGRRGRPVAGPYRHRPQSASYYVLEGSLRFQKNELLLVSFIRFFSDINKPYSTAEINPVLEEVFTQK